MACRGSGVRVALAPLNFSSYTNSFQAAFSNNITFVLNLFETRFKTFENDALIPVIAKLLKNGAKRTRTADPLHAMQVLYQLSYGPMCAFY